jgi:thiol-disulfide isomerase/thioredoxin
MAPRALSPLAAVLPLLLLACGRDAPEPEPEPPPAASQAASHGAPSKLLGVEFVPAPAEGAVQEIVRAEIVRTTHDGRQLLVYVGAKWCEPCRRFHDAAKAGKLDQAFPSLRLLEFDLDADRDRLMVAGYASRMIPLFALPRTDGMGSGDQIEGSIKGEGAVDQISPRLARLLSGAGGDPPR